MTLQRFCWQDQSELKILTENAIENMPIWLRTNGLKLNWDKTQFVKFKTARSNDKQDLSVQVCGQDINSTFSAYFFRITLDQKLKWKLD